MGLNSLERDPSFPLWRADVQMPRRQRVETENEVWENMWVRRKACFSKGRGGTQLLSPQLHQLQAQGPSPPEVSGPGCGWGMLRRPSNAWGCSSCALPWYPAAPPPPPAFFHQLCLGHQGHSAFHTENKQLSWRAITVPQGLSEGFIKNCDGLEFLSRS